MAAQSSKELQWLDLLEHQYSNANKSHQSNMANYSYPHINPCDAGNRVYQDDSLNTIAVDALAPLARSSASMRITRSLSSTRKDFNYLCHFSVDK